MEYHTAIKMSCFGKLLKREYAGGSVVKNLPANAADSGGDERGRSPRERNDNPLQYSYLGNPLDRGAWGATIHGVTKESDMTERLNNNKNKHVKMNVKREHGLLHIYIIYTDNYAAAAKSIQSCPTLCNPRDGPHRRQPTRLPHPWDSPGKNTGMGCHFFLQCMKVKSESEVAQLCPTLSDPTDCSSPGSSVHGIFQARVLEWSATAFSNTNNYIYI